MTQLTWEKIRERKRDKDEMSVCKTRAKKIELQKIYTEKNREVKRSTRNDQRNYIDNLASQAEEATSKGNLKELFAITRVLSKRQMQRNRPIRATDGTLLINTKEQLQRWQEHFSKILNSGVDKQIVEEEKEKGEYVTNPRINTKAPTAIEIKKAVKEQKRGKAAGVENIPPEVLKVDLDISANLLNSLFEKIWNEGEMPNDWKCGLLIKIPKKGYIANCDNWWGITLLSIPSKVYTSILINTIKEHDNHRLRKEQAGFRPNRSCIVQMNTLRIVTERVEWSSRLYAVFIDFEKAFDSVNREAMWK
jgi:hypothetical protein